MCHAAEARCSSCVVWWFLWPRCTPNLPAARPALCRGPMPYASPERTQRLESRPPFVHAQEAIIPIEPNVPSPSVLALSDRDSAEVQALILPAAMCHMHGVLSMGLFSDETLCPTPNALRPRRRPRRTACLSIA